MKKSTATTSALAVACLATLVLGCADTSRLRLQTPRDVPRFEIDVAASEVRAVGLTNAEDLRQMGADALSEMAETANGVSQPARFEATISARDKVNAGGMTCAVVLFPLFIVPVPLFGGMIPMTTCVTDRLVAIVDLKVQVGDKTYAGHGESDHGATRSASGETWAAAVHDAFQRAMQNAKAGTESAGGSL